MPKTPLSVDVVVPVVPVPPTLPAAFAPTLASTAGPLAVLLAPVDIPVEVSVPADMPDDESVPVVGVVLVEPEPRCDRWVECVLRAARLVVAVSLDDSGSLGEVASVELGPVVLGLVVLGPVVLGRVWPDGAVEPVPTDPPLMPPVVWAVATAGIHSAAIAVR